MAEVAGKARTRTVETITKEEIPLTERESQALGKPWPEWLRERTPDQLAITEVMIYRREPPPGGFLEKLGGNSGVACEPIDENWIANRYGGGVYGIRIYSKDGKSSYEPALRITGEPKPSPRERAQQAATAPPASNGDNGIGRLVDVLERTIDRLQQHPVTPAAAPSQGAKEIIETMSALEDLRAKVHPAPPTPPAPKSALDDIQSILQLVEKLKPAPPQETPFEKAMREAMVAQLTQPKKSLIDELEGLGKLLPLIQNFAGGEKADWKTALIEKGLERVPEIIDGVGKVMDKRVSEAQALAVRDQARAQAIAIARGSAAAPAAPIPAGPVPVQTSAKAPAEPAPWKPLEVVPIDEPLAAAARATPEVIPPGTPIQASPEQYIDAYLKNRIVQLVAQHAEAGLVVDVIDAMAPEVGAMLSQASESHVRDFIGKDPVLREIAELPHYERFLAEFLEVLHEEPETARIQ
jgi:hypothetical protein